MGFHAELAEERGGRGAQPIATAAPTTAECRPQSPCLAWGVDGEERYASAQRDLERALETVRELRDENLDLLRRLMKEDE